MSVEVAIAQILLECKSGARTLDPALEIALGLSDGGYVIVPREPTPESVAAWCREKNSGGSDYDAYRALVKAANLVGGLSAFQIADP